MKEVIERTLKELKTGVSDETIEKAKNGDIAAIEKCRTLLKTKLEATELFDLILDEFEKTL